LLEEVSNHEDEEELDAKTAEEVEMHRNINFRENIEIYLKPRSDGDMIWCHFGLVILDWLLGLTFCILQLYYLHTNDFHTTNDKLL
jgi:hypothetical protein